MTSAQAKDRDNRTMIRNSTAAEVLVNLAKQFGYHVRIVITRPRKVKP